MSQEKLTVLRLDRKTDFVETPYIQSITQRALDYLRAGYPVHFSGPAGTGKTTLAMHVAALLGRDVMLLHGDDEFGSSDLIGAQSGYRSTKVIDNYIHSVMKKEESMSTQWVDNRLTTACKYGFTLIYDEFTRSRPEANNVLLSILEERLLELPGVHVGESYLSVHPNFNAIFTSNPEEYAGVHKTQDALMDRMVTIKLDYPDIETEVAIVHAKSGLSWAQSRSIVGIVREFRDIGGDASRLTIRACLMLGRVVAARNGAVVAGDTDFKELCFDVMNSNSHVAGIERLDEIIQKHCPMPPKLVIIDEATPEVTPPTVLKSSKSNKRNSRHGE
jgi:nitric oxide reductase NorQ protein